MLKIIGTLFVVGLIVFLWWIIFYIGWMDNYSEGQRTGDVYKFSKKGIWYKSWEGEMYLGGVHQAGTAKTGYNLELDKHYFSIPYFEETIKSDLIIKLNKCSEERLLCSVKYQQWFKRPIYQDSRYTVIGVEIK